MRSFFTFLFAICFICINAQDVKYLTIVPKFMGENLQLNNPYILKNDTLVITNFKFYISNLRYLKNDSLVYTSNKPAHLIDLASEQSLQISETNFLNFDNIKFSIGIDSLTNISGVFDGDLDPVNGMYWTWQSGFINFKVEGIASNCPARNNKFYWHIGGYEEPFYAMREISLNCKSESSIKIVIHLEKLFWAIDVSKVYQVMSPSEKAIGIANELPEIFSIEKE